jgi:hypothetical protein
MFAAIPAFQWTSTRRLLAELLRQQSNHFKRPLTAQRNLFLPMRRRIRSQRVSLEIGSFPVNDVKFGSETRWHDGVLEVDRDEITGLILQDPLIKSAKSMSHALVNRLA